MIGGIGQQRLADASVLVVGCGALGGQLAMLLAGSGVGRIGIADFDTVDITNLQRQLFFTETDAGKGKAPLIAARMRALNSEIQVDVYETLISDRNAAEIFSRYGFIVDATDNPASKYMVDRYAGRLGIPCCIGGVAGWRGQVTMLSPEEGGVRYMDLFPAPDSDPGVLPCAVEGVMGMAASTVASLQAAEVVKWISGEDESRASRMIALDLGIPSFDVFGLRPFEHGSFI